MIQQLLHKFLSTTLAIVVLFSTVSFTIEKHYCGNTLVDTAIFSQVKKCGMEMQKETSTDTLKKKSCCKDEIEVVKGQNELKFSSFDDLAFHQQLFIASFVYYYTNLFDGLPQLIIPHKNYSPPNLVVDIQVLDQVFII